VLQLFAKVPLLNDDCHDDADGKGLEKGGRPQNRSEDEEDDDHVVDFSHDFPGGEV